MHEEGEGAGEEEGEAKPKPALKKPAVHPDRGLGILVGWVRQNGESS